MFWEIDVKVTLTNAPVLPDGFEYTGQIGSIPSDAQGKGLWLCCLSVSPQLTWCPYPDQVGLLVRQLPKWRPLRIEDLKNISSEPIYEFSVVYGDEWWKPGQLLGFEVLDGVAMWKHTYGELDGMLRVSPYGRIKTTDWDVALVPGYYPNWGFRLEASVQ